MRAYWFVGLCIAASVTACGNDQDNLLAPTVSASESQSAATPSPVVNTVAAREGHPGVKVLGQTGCVTLAELDREWGFGINSHQGNPPRVFVKLWYDDEDNCDNVNTASGGRLTNLMPVNGIDTVIDPAGGNIFFALDNLLNQMKNGIPCGRYEAEAWTSDGHNIANLHVRAGNRVNCSWSTETPTTPPKTLPPPTFTNGCPATFDPNFTVLTGNPTWDVSKVGSVTALFMVKPNLQQILLSLASYVLNGISWEPQALSKVKKDLFMTAPGTLAVTIPASGPVQVDLFRCFVPNTDLTAANWDWHTQRLATPKSFAWRDNNGQWHFGG